MLRRRIGDTVGGRSVAYHVFIDEIHRRKQPWRMKVGFDAGFEWI